MLSYQRSVWESPISLAAADSSATPKSLESGCEGVALAGIFQGSSSYVANHAVALMLEVVQTALVWRHISDKAAFV